MPRFDMLELLECPISYELMEDPVITVSTGHSFERNAIEEWFRTHNTHPLTRQTLTPAEKELKPNYSLKGIIDHYKQKACSIETFTQAVLTLDYEKLVGDLLYPRKYLTKSIDNATRFTPLHYVLDKNFMPLVRHFLAERKGLKILEVKDAAGRTPLDLAIIKNNSEAIGLILNAHDNKKQLDSFDSLYRYCLAQHISLAELLLQHKFDLTQLKDKNNTSLLHFLCTKNDLIEADKLLAQGCSINIEDGQRKTLLDTAISSKNKVLINYALERDAKINSFQLLFETYPDFDISILKNIDQKDDNFFSAVQTACQNNYPKIVEALLKYNAKLNLFHELFIFCETNHISVLNFLVSKKINLKQFNYKDAANCSLLETAYIHQDRKLIKQLVQQNGEKFLTREGLKKLSHLTFLEKIKIEQCIMSFDSINERNKRVQQEIIEPNKENLLKNKKPAEKIAKLFQQYANPGLFSSGFFASRSAESKKLAEEISKALTINKEWSGEKCKQYIAGLHIDHTIIKHDTFKGLLSYIKKTNFDKLDQQNINSVSQQDAANSLYSSSSSSSSSSYYGFRH